MTERTLLTNAEAWEEKEKEAQDDIELLYTMYKHVGCMYEVMKEEKAHEGFNLLPAIEVLQNVAINQTDTLVKPLLRAYRLAIAKTKVELDNIRKLKALTTK